MAQAMGYERIWGMKGQFWCKFEFCISQKVWVKRVYELREVWVKRGLTVVTVYMSLLQVNSERLRSQARNIEVVLVKYN